MGWFLASLGQKTFCQIILERRGQLFLPSANGPVVKAMVSIAISTAPLSRSPWFMRYVFSALSFQFLQTFVFGSRSDWYIL